jgi:hypothetical protein
VLQQMEKDIDDQIAALRDDKADANERVGFLTS